MSSIPNPALAQRLMSQLLSIIQSRNNSNTITKFKEILQLEKVDNTRDVDKPVSNQTALVIQTGEVTNARPLNFTFSQNNASTSWTVVHNLNRRPTVSIVNSLGEEIYGDIFHFNVNTLQVTFSVPLSGTAYLV
jgi:GTP cyclohydrolase III